MTRIPCRYCAICSAIARSSSVSLSVLATGAHHEWRTQCATCDHPNATLAESLPPMRDESGTGRPTETHERPRKGSAETRQSHSESRWSWVQTKPPLTPCGVPGDAATAVQNSHRPKARGTHIKPVLAVYKLAACRLPILTDALCKITQL